ncbi:unnamed protein product [Meloidogyne enterolobii]|uniref:Uncharacterized protein n=1 Tax=Meloidogyne enterolobii TaxID=390850 RepID=A0ACB1AI23_MELEN
MPKGISSPHSFFVFFFFYRRVSVCVWNEREVKKNGVGKHSNCLAVGCDWQKGEIGAAPHRRPSTMRESFKFFFSALNAPPCLTLVRRSTRQRSSPTGLPSKIFFYINAAF